MSVPVSQGTTSPADYLELLREASKAQSLSEQGDRLLRRIRAMFGAELFVGVMAVPDQPEYYKLFEIVSLSDTEVEHSNSGIDASWDEIDKMPVHQGGLFGRLIQSEQPTLVIAESTSDDVAMLEGRRIPPYAMVLPIFRAGAVREWTVFFRSEPWSVSESEMLALTQVSNMMALAGERELLVRHVSALNERLSTSLESILDAQRSIVPPHPPAVRGLRFAVWYEPSEEVGGDYYDFRDFGGGQFGVVVADVSGHGPPASVAMGMLRSVLMAYREFGRPARTVVTDVNRVLFEALAGERFVTAIFVAFKPKSGRFVYANAGHHVPRVRRRDGHVEPISGNASPPLGILAHLDTLGASGQLKPGECMVLYTDGVIEAFDEHREQFGVERLDEAIAQAEPDPDAIAESIRVAVGAFSEEEVVDDRCVLVVMREA